MVDGVQKDAGKLYLTADCFQLLDQVLSLIRWKMSDVNSFVCRANTVSGNLFSQQLYIQEYVN